MTNLENIRYCPKCDKEADIAIACSLEHHFLPYLNLATGKRLDLPYFLCGNCRLAYIDTGRLKEIIRMEIEELPHSKKKEVSRKQAYQESIEFLERIIEKIGYKKVARFNKSPRK